MASESCPKCGAARGTIRLCYTCGSYFTSTDNGVVLIESQLCLRNQLAAANTRIAELEAGLLEVTRLFDALSATFSEEVQG